MKNWAVFIVSMLATTMAVFAVIYLADNETNGCWFSNAGGGVGCYLRKYPELSGAMLGALGTILAGLIAWFAVQGQIAKADIVYWQNQKDMVVLALAGIAFDEVIVDALLAEFHVINEGVPFPFIDALTRAQRKGLFYTTHLTPMGNRFTSWHLSKWIGDLRAQFDLVGRGQNEDDRPGAEQIIKSAVLGIRAVQREMEIANLSEKKARRLATDRLHSLGVSK